MAQANCEENRTIQRANPKLKLDEHRVISSENEAVAQLTIEIRNRANKYND